MVYRGRVSNVSYQLLPAKGIKKRTLKSCIGVGSGSVLLEGSRAFWSDERRVWFAGGLVSFLTRVKSITVRLNIPAASAKWPAAAVIPVAHSLQHDFLKLKDAGC